MKPIRSIIRTVSVCVAIAIAAVMLATPTFALDKVLLKDGTVREGKIARELESGAIYLEMQIGSLVTGEWFRPDQIKEIVRDEALAAEEAREAAEEEAAAFPDGATRIAFISLEEMVGPFFNKDAIEKSIGMLDDLPEHQQPEIVVFEIDSGGGALFELEKITKYMHEEVNPKYRTVAWIRYAISAAAMTSWVIPEIYMMPQGSIGACTGYYMDGGKAVAMSGDDLEEALIMMEEVSVWGGRSDLAPVMRAMQILETLSATKHPDGTIEWFLNDSGEDLVSRKDEILSFDAIQAVRWGVADGIAESRDELALAMGCSEWVEVGEKADEYQREFRENVERAQVKISEHYDKLQIALAYAGSAPTEREKDRNIGEARRHLKEMKSWVNRAPSLKVYMGLTDERFRELDRQIRDLAR